MMTAAYTYFKKSGPYGKCVFDATEKNNYSLKVTLAFFTMLLFLYLQLTGLCLN